MKKNLITFFIFIFCLAGCQGNPFRKEKVDELTTLKIVYSDTQEIFDQYYKDFLNQHPNIKIEVIKSNPFDYKALSESIADNKPDLVFVSSYNYAQLVREQRLQELDEFVVRDHIKLDDIDQGIIEGLRSVDGKIYALSDTFNTNALIYNKKIFDMNHIEYPNNGINWSEFLELLSRFNSIKQDENKHVYAYVSKNGPADLVNMITSSWSIVNSDRRTINIETDKWERLFKQLYDLYKSGAVTDSENIATNSISFENGQVAMDIGDSRIFSHVLKKTEKNEPIDVGIIRAPVDSESSGNNNMGLLGIASSTKKPDEAWNFIKYLLSEQRFQTLHDQSSLLTLSINKKYMHFDMDPKLEPLYGQKLNIVLETGTRDVKRPANIKDILNSELSRMLKDQQSIAITLENIKDRLQKELQKSGN